MEETPCSQGHLRIPMGFGGENDSNVASNLCLIRLKSSSSIAKARMTLSLAFLTRRSSSFRPGQEKAALKAFTIR